MVVAGWLSARRSLFKGSKEEAGSEESTSIDNVIVTIDEKGDYEWIEWLEYGPPTGLKYSLNDRCWVRAPAI